MAEQRILRDRRAVDGAMTRLAAVQAQVEVIASLLSPQG
jgi:hypothetical protein